MDRYDLPEPKNNVITPIIFYFIVTQASQFIFCLSGIVHCCRGYVLFAPRQLFCVLPHRKQIRIENQKSPNN
jgi:hypothetical protein